MGKPIDTETNKTEELVGTEIDIFFSENPLDVVYGPFRLFLKMLNAEDIKAAELAAKRPGGSRRSEKVDDEKHAEALLSRCVLGWEHKNGGPILLNGSKLECTPANINMVSKKMPGLASFIFKHVTDTDRMYRTLEESEIKN